jgi:hypothetical protein
MVMPQLGFGENPHWDTIVYDGEPMALGYRTLNGVEGINEVHRLEEVDGRIARIRCYCFCPDTLRVLGEHLGIVALDPPASHRRASVRSRASASRSVRAPEIQWRRCEESRRRRRTACHYSCNADENLFLFLVGHAVCDFVLQGEVMGNSKNRKKWLAAAHGSGFPPWYYWLGAHGFTHGGAVFLISGLWQLGAIETALHALIDYSKCEGPLLQHGPGLHWSSSSTSVLPGSKPR